MLCFKFHKSQLVLGSMLSQDSGPSVVENRIEAILARDDLGRLFGVSERLYQSADAAFAIKCVSLASSSSTANPARVAAR